MKNAYERNPQPPPMKLQKQVIVDGRNFGTFSKEKLKRMEHLKGVEVVCQIVVKQKRVKLPPHAGAKFIGRGGNNPAIHR